LRAAFRHPGNLTWCSLIFLWSASAWQATQWDALRIEARTSDASNRLAAIRVVKEG